MILLFSPSLLLSHWGCASVSVLLSLVTDRPPACCLTTLPQGSPLSPPSTLFLSLQKLCLTWSSTFVNPFLQHLPWEALGKHLPMLKLEKVGCLYERWLYLKVTFTESVILHRVFLTFTRFLSCSDPDPRLQTSGCFGSVSKTLWLCKVLLTFAEAWEQGRTKVTELRKSGNCWGGGTGREREVLELNSCTPTDGCSFQLGPF